MLTRSRHIFSQYASLLAQLAFVPIPLASTFFIISDFGLSPKLASALARYWAAGISTRMKLHSYLPPSPRLAGSQAHPRGHRRHAASLCFHATLPAKLAFAAYPSMWISVRITSMWTIWRRATFVRCRRHIRCSTFLDYVDGYCQIGKVNAVGCKPIMIHGCNEYLFFLVMHT